MLAKYVGIKINNVEFLYKNSLSKPILCLKNMKYIRGTDNRKSDTWVGPDQMDIFSLRMKDWSRRLNGKLRVKY